VTQTDNCWFGAMLAFPERRHYSWFVTSCRCGLLRYLLFVSTICACCGLDILWTLCGIPSAPTNSGHLPACALRQARRFHYSHTLLPRSPTPTTNTAARTCSVSLPHYYSLCRAPTTAGSDATTAGIRTFPTRLQPRRTHGAGTIYGLAAARRWCHCRRACRHLPACLTPAFLSITTA